jgi:hypothetical protein
MKIDMSTIIRVKSGGREIEAMSISAPAAGISLVTQAVYLLDISSLWSNLPQKLFES